MQILSSNFYTGLDQRPHNTAMCECLGCSGCKQSRKCQGGKCNENLGKYYEEKCAQRCHWCFNHIEADRTNLPVVVVHGDRSKRARCNRSGATEHAATHVPATEVTTVRLLIDSVGRLKSKGKEYINEVQTRVAFQGNKIIEKEIFIAGDLPEIAAYFERDDCHPYVNSNSCPCDLNLIILMSNYAANTLGQDGISEPMVRACCCLQKVAESVPTYVIYGGPAEMWNNVVRCGGLKCFDTKAKQIRDLLATSGEIKVNSGAEDFRAFFATSDLDDIGHIKGLAREKAVRWLAKQVMDAANHRRQVMALHS